MLAGAVPARVTTVGPGWPSPRILRGPILPLPPPRLPPQVAGGTRVPGPQGAPAPGRKWPASGVVTLEEFAASAQQIQDYWRAATARSGPLSAGDVRPRVAAQPLRWPPPAGDSARRLLTRAAIAVAAVVAAGVLATALFEGVQAWALHSGLGAARFE